MRHKDPELMKRIQAFAEDFYFEEGRSPSTAEIGKAIGIAKGTAHRYLVEMSEKGQIDYDGKSIETEKIRRLSPASRAEIFTGAIPCGPLETVEASADEYAKLPTAIFGSGDFYIIRTTGDSMINAGIESGDLVVVEKRCDAKPGEIVVALHENANTLKRLGYDKKRKCCKLIPENDGMEPIYVRDVVIQGVARFIIKAL